MDRNHRATNGALAAAAAALPLWAAFAAPSLAQTETATLEEVVVTAQRRSEDIQKTPIPMTAISGEEITKKGQSQLDEVLRDVPALQIQSAPQGADIVIRGVGGNDTGGISQDPDVSVFSDGVYSGLAATNLGTVYDVNRVEVLRGPQGTLYGRNSAGGAVNILTNDPAGTFGAGVNVGVGNLNLRRADGFINLPATPTLAFRLAVDRDVRDGYYGYPNIANGAGRAGEVDNFGARAKAKWTPSESLSLLAVVDYWHQKGLTETTVPIKDSGAPPFLLPANPGNPWDPNTVVIPGPPNFTSAPVGNDNKIYRYSLQADLDLGFGVLTMIPSYSRSDQFQYGCGGLFAPAGPCTDASTITNKQTTFETRLASEPTSTTKWVVGVYGLDSKADQSGMAPGASQTFFAQQADNKRPATSYAGFAQVTVPVSSVLRATAGARYTVDEKKIFYGVCSSTDGVTCGPSSTGAGTYISPATDLKNRYNSFTYKAGLEYDLTPTALAYAQISTGYKAGGYSTATFPPVAYDPERLTNYELGIKSRLFDNRLEINADVYFYQYHNQQIELHVVTGYAGVIPNQYIPAAYLPGGASAATNNAILDVNAGDSRYRGVELQSKYQFTSRDQLRIAAVYNRAVYGNFLIDTSGGPPGTGYSSQFFDLTGQQEAHAPLWSGSAGYQHVFRIGDGELTFDGNLRWQTKSYTTIQQWFANGNTVQKSYHQSDVNLTYAPAGDHWNVGVWGKNLENNAVVTYVYPLFKQTLDISRTYGVNASYKF